MLALTAAGLLAVRPAVAQITIAGTPRGGPSSDVRPYRYFGVEFTVAGTDTYDHLTFNFFSFQDATVPVAAGTAFLLTEPFINSPETTPDRLGESVPGFVAASTGIVGGRYVFDPRVTVAGGRTYYMFENGPVVDAAFTNFALGNPVGVAAASNPDQVFSRIPYAYAYFQLQGTAVTAAPEPGTWALLGTGLLVVGGVRLRRRRAVTT